MSDHGMISRDPGRDVGTLFRTLIHDLNDFAIFVMDPDGIITTWNAGVERNLGYTEQEFIGQPISIIFTQEDVEKNLPAIERTAAARDGRAPDVRWHRRKDGSLLYVDGVLTSLRNDSGELLGFSKVMRDITKRKLTDDALQRSNRELSQFAYVVSHDLQAPLRAVSIYTELLVKQCESCIDDKGTDFATFIREGVQQMQTLIRDLLKYSQISNSDSESRSVELDKVLDQALNNHKPAIVDSGAAITRDPLPVVRGDETHFVQLFQNLLGNALKYRGPEPPAIHVGAEQVGRDWRIFVRDNGIGIDHEYADKIFEPFKRLHGSEVPGTGVGLAICKKIVERYGGRIWVESTPGDGSTFYFTLPVDSS
jgi:PAS domain S-box-containing protein